MYKDANEAFQKGDVEGARKKFEALLKQYPNTELSGNAQFWIGETYYQKRDFERAILEYEKAITKYPEGSKIPAALFKQALAFLELGDKTNARNLFKRVIDRFPHSDQAEMAKKKLEAMNKPPVIPKEGLYLLPERKLRSRLWRISNRVNRPRRDNGMASGCHFARRGLPCALIHFFDQ